MSPQTPVRNLILAVDGSEHAQAATRLVQDLPLPTACQITVLVVLIPRYGQHSAAHRQILAQTQQVLEQSHHRTVKTELLTGDPAEQIVAYAEQHQPDLMVIGARGLRATLGILLGGVAQHVVEYACCPVLVVRAPYQGIRQVLLAIDGSEHSQKALQHLQMCPLPRDVEIHLAHVLPPEIDPEIYYQNWRFSADYIAPIITEDMLQRFKQQNEKEQLAGEQLLNNSIEKVHTIGYTAHRALLRGDASTELLAYAQENRIDLLMVGSRGLSPFQGWLLGSVSRKLVHYTECSVLIVK